MPMPRQILTFTALAIGLLTAVAAPPLSAQETFELGEEGFEKVESPDPSTPEGRLQVARRALAAGHPERAVELASRWIDRHPGHPLLPEAYLLRADAKAAQERFYDALYDYEMVLRSFPGSDAFDTALERELKIAQAFARGVKRRLWGLRIATAYSEAEEILIRIQERAPGSKIAERAGIELADFYYRRSDMELAATAYDLFLQNYPDSQWAAHALRRQVMANLASFQGPRFDATNLLEARSRLRDYQDIFPAAAERIGAEALLTRIDETLARRSLLVAQWYERQDNDVSAIFMYKRLIEEHPGSAAAREALGRLRELDPELFRAPVRESEAADRPRERERERAEASEPAAELDEAMPAPVPPPDSADGSDAAGAAEDPSP